MHADTGNGKQLLGPAAKYTHTCVTGVHVCACVCCKLQRGRDRLHGTDGMIYRISTAE